MKRRRPAGTSALIPNSKLVAARTQGQGSLSADPLVLKGDKRRTSGPRTGWDVILRVYAARRQKKGWRFLGISHEAREIAKDEEIKRLNLPQRTIFRAVRSML